MTKNLDSEGLKSIAQNYDLFYIDLWGVMHNGVKLHEGAIFTLKKLLEINKDFILLTNAPRPIQPVKEFLEKMGMEKEFRDKVFTSGEAALNYLKKFFKFQINDDKIKNILETTSFSNFKDLENKGFFQEANVDKTGKIKKFFNEGPNKKWQNSLEKSLSNKIEENFLIEMKKLGYLE